MATTAKIARDESAGAKAAGTAQAALPASQPLLPLRTLREAFYENYPSCAASVSASCSGRGSSRRDQSFMVMGLVRSPMLMRRSVKE